MSEQLVKSPLEWIDVTIKIFPYAGAIALALYVLARTNAMFYIVYRWHQLLGAGKEFNSKFAQRVWADHEDLQRFNLWFGLNLRTSKHMARLLSWLDRQEISIEELCRARRYFDANELRFKIPSSRRRRSIRSLIGVWITLLLLANAVFAQTPYALLTVKKTGSTFWVQAGEAFNGTATWLAWAGTSPWKVDSKDCLFTNHLTPFEDQWDRDVVCELVLGNHNQLLESTIGEQKAIGLSAGAGAFCWFLYLVFIVTRERNAKALVERVVSDTD